MNNPTPGPWEVLGPNLEGMAAAIMAPHGKKLFVVAHIESLLSGFPGDADANARLIVAAPKLFDALKYVVKQYAYPDSYGKRMIPSDSMRAIVKLLTEIEGKGVQS